MIHDPALIDLLQSLPSTSFDGDVFRATGLNSDPTAFSASGGRWAPADEKEGGFSILYTSLKRDGAVAEVASYLELLDPVPRTPLKVSTLAVGVERALRIVLDAFGQLGIDRAPYGQRNYRRTQEIGAAINFLEYDGLIAPSARWQCDNLMILANHHALEAKLEVKATEVVGFEEWRPLATAFTFGGQ